MISRPRQHFATNPSNPSSGAVPATLTMLRGERRSDPCARCERKGWDWCATCNAKMPVAQPQRPPSSLHAMPTFEAEVPGDLAISLQTFRELQALQTREIEPEDYDLLLLLSEAKPHLSEEQLQRVSKRVNPLTDGSVDDSCAVCLAAMKPGEDLTALACAGRHIYHSLCISEWLLTASTCCPVDNQDLSNAMAAPLNID